MSGALDNECRRCDVSASLTNEVDGAGEKAKWDGETSLMTKAEMNLRARGLAPRVEATEAEPVKAAARKAPAKKAAPKAKPATTEEA